MFTAKDLLSMTDYFDFLSTDGETCFEVMSKNTTHCWKIVDVGTHYRLMHAHQLSDGYHLHGEFDLMLDCVLEIVEHDEWKIGLWRHRYKGKRKLPYTFFDELIDRYVRVPAYA
ncbi:MAG: hypothetical protein J5959_14225 [Butyrivibrio sp.]|nr:hypothetical protein [Butyrivibrio sp.]